MTCSGYCTATSRLKSTTPTPSTAASSSVATARRLSSSSRSAITAIAAGLNQSLVRHAVLGVVRSIHVDQRADLHRLALLHLERDVGGEDRDRRVGEQRRLALDRHHRVVADHRPERRESLGLDPVHRSVGVQVEHLAPP